MRNDHFQAAAGNFFDPARLFVRLANDSIYGLAAGVWAGTTERAMAVARQIRAGQVDVNGGRFNPQAPFGGCKKSGLGRENGPLALEEYLQTKASQQ